MTLSRYVQVYISCSVMMCEAGNPNSRCSQGCSNSTSGHRNSKRSVVTQTSRHFISQGPLRLRRSAQEGAGSSGMKTESVFFIARLPCLRSSSNCFLSPFSSGEPEPEPCVHRWMCSCSCGHDQCSGPVQSQNVEGWLPASVHR